MREITKTIIGNRGLSAAVYLLLGTLIIIFSESAPMYICFAFGALIFVVGVYSLIHHIIKKEMLMGLPFDIILIVFGAILLIFSKFIATVLAVMIGGMFFVKAAFDVQKMLIAKKLGYKSWVCDLVFTLIEFIASVLLVCSPFYGQVIISILLGSVLIFAGLITIGIMIFDIKLGKEKMNRFKRSFCDADFIDIIDVEDNNDLNDESA